MRTRAPRIGPRTALRVLGLPLLAASSLGSSACGASDPTEIVVLVDTDLPIAAQDATTPVAPGQIRSISFRITCTAEPGDSPCRLRGRDMSVFEGLTQSYEAAGLGARPPFYFVLERDAPGAVRTFRVDATALVGPAGSDEETVTVSASAATVEGESRVLILPLREECLNVDCGTDATCALGGGCGPIAQTPPSWPGTCAAVSRPGLASRECDDNQFRE
ncbi:MAG: hypothetical protein U0353_35060 [Sandaracinus sp.]